MIFIFSIQKFLVNVFLTAKIRFNLTSKKKIQTSEKIENIIGFMILNKAIYFLFIFFAGLQENTFLTLTGYLKLSCFLTLTGYLKLSWFFPATFLRIWIAISLATIGGSHMIFNLQYETSSISFISNRLFKWSYFWIY